jgi:hypothetical protein
VGLFLGHWLEIVRTTTLVLVAEEQAQKAA